MYVCIHRSCDQHPKTNPLVLLPDNKGWTPLHYACYDNNKKLVQQLRDAGADPNARYTLGEHILLQVIVYLFPSPAPQSLKHALERGLPASYTGLYAAKTKLLC